MICLVKSSIRFNSKDLSQFGQSLGCSYGSMACVFCLYYLKNKLIYYALLYCSLLEKGDTIFTFEGDKKKCPLKIVLKVQNPQFYWKVCTHTLCFRPVQSKLNINPVQFLLKTKNCIKNRKNRKPVVQPGNSKAGMAEPVLERFCLTSKKKTYIFFKK